MHICIYIYMYIYIYIYMYIVGGVRRGAQEVRHRLPHAYLPPDAGSENSAVGVIDSADVGAIGLAGGKCLVSQNNVVNMSRM